MACITEPERTSRAVGRNVEAFRTISAANIASLGYFIGKIAWGAGGKAARVYRVEVGYVGARDHAGRAVGQDSVADRAVGVTQNADVGAWIDPIAYCAGEVAGCPTEVDVVCGVDEAGGALTVGTSVAGQTPPVAGPISNDELSEAPGGCGIGGFEVGDRP